MHKMAEVFMYFIILLSSYSCWVMTDINYEDLNLDNDILEDDMDTEMSEGVARQKFSLIFPGTKWCGAGDVAEGYDDLGSARETDMCCRDHDNCPDIIVAGQTKYNLTNTAFYTRLSCQCDETFRQCLRDANSSVARKIGKIYFNALGTKCYRLDYPVTGCSAHGGWFKRKCLEPIYDEQGERLYQWFDVNNY